jgi:glutamate racemase
MEMPSRLNPDAPVGVFDSGIGGLSILRALRGELPDERFVYLADSGHAPYGERDPAHTIERSRAVTRDLRERYGIKALVIACNTATTAAIHLLRAEHADLPLIGVEPAIKPGLARTATGRIGVIGTRGTVASAKFAALLASLSGQGEVTVQACDGLATAIENQLLRPGETAARLTADLCVRYLGEMGEFGVRPGQIDTLVLGCTHYIFAADALRTALGGAKVELIENGVPVARQTRRLLAEKNLLARHGRAEIAFETTGDPALLETAAARWLALPGSSVVTAVAHP